MSDTKSPCYQTLHIMHKDKFNNRFIEFMNANYPDDHSKHVYIFSSGDENFPPMNTPNTFEIPFIYDIKAEVYAKLVQLMNTSERIILHGLFNQVIVKLLFENQAILKKCIWIIWGGDLYYFKHKDHTDVASNSYEELRRDIISKLFGIAAGIYGDYALAKDIYGFSGKHYNFAYPLIAKRPTDLLKVNKNDRDTITFLVGNSADPTNNHEDVLHSLARFKENNIQVIIPLSYGNKVHADNISEIAYNLLGMKVRILREYIDPEEYNKLLSSVDIAVFNHDRQQAVNSIITLLSLGKKVYLRSNVTTWDYLISNFKVKLHDSLDLPKLSYQDLVSGIDDNSNSGKMRVIYEDTYYKSLYDPIFCKYQSTSTSKPSQSVSVVIPSFNRAKFISKCITSVLSQTYPIKEIIIADDGSTDNTREIADIHKSDDNVKFVFLDKNRGAQAARNEGIRVATGDWIAFLDSDDEWLPNRLTDAFDAARNKSAGVVYSNYYQRRFLDEGVSDLLVNPEIHEGNVLEAILRKSFVSFPGLTVRRDHLFEIGLLDESIRSWQEWDTCIRLAEKFEFAYSPHPSFIWNWHSGETISKDVLRDAMGIIQIVLKHYQLFLSVAGKDVLYLHFSAALNKLQQVDGENVELLRVKIRTALKQLGNNT